MTGELERLLDELTWPVAGLDWTHHKSPAAPERPGHGTREVSPGCTATLTPQDLAFAAQIRAAAMRDKSYRASPIGGEVGRYLRALRWSNRSDNTIENYELVLARLAVDFAHLTLDELTTEHVREFLDEHWGESSAATRKVRLTTVRSFLGWAIEEGRCTLLVNPATKIKAPRLRNQERNAYKPDVVHALITAQETIRDQIALMLLGWLALRKNELRLIQVRDFDLGEGTVLIHGKGGKQVVLPLGFDQLKRNLELHLLDKDPGEYLLYPKRHAYEPMSPSAVHRWLKRCLERAGLPETIKTHELRHSAADNLWRQSGNLLLAQQLLRHESVATTQVYLHPNRDDLARALAELGKAE